MSSPPNCKSNKNDDDEIKILIATDIHLGFEYNKKRGVESEDSFITFEEILQYGKKYEVDFILLGGDLFHDTKPTQSAVLKCMELLRKYCLGSREIKIEFLSDPNVVFRHCAYKTVNYEDPNLNISMPIFSIHGNHDDPSFGAIGSMDLLSVSGLINYFGKWTDLSKITIPPLIIKKGETHIALYGLSYINDQRLSRLLRDFKVDMLRPTGIENCFNMFVLHQNRVQRNKYDYIPQTVLPDFLNFVIWGHEHECRITPEFIPETEYFISQPGSSIVTSLCESEAVPKHIGILSVNKMKFKMKTVKLQTVRPFIFDNLILEEHDISNNYASVSASVYNFVDEYIENELIPKAATQLSGHVKQPIQPLLRLRIHYTSDDETFDTMKLAQKYCDEVANPMDIITFRKKISTSKSSKLSFSNLNDELEEMAQVLCYNDEDKDWNRTVQGGIKKHFSLEENRDKLTVLTVDGLNEALNGFVDRGDTDAFKDIVNHQMKKTIAYLETCEVGTAESICNEIKNFRDQRAQDEQEEEIKNVSLFNSEKNSREKSLEINTDEDINSDEDIGLVGRENEESTVAPATKGKRGRGASRGTTRGTTRGRGSRGGGRGKNKTNVENSLDATSTLHSTNIQHPKKQTKKQGQSSLQSYIRSSNQTKTKAGQVLIIDDSD